MAEKKRNGRRHRMARGIAQPMAGKLRSVRGESLIETMFALMVGSLSVMLLVTMISMSARLIRLGEEDAGHYTENLNAMTNPSVDGRAELRFYSGSDDTEGTGYEVPVKISSFQDSRKELVIAYAPAASDG